jgi:hypothetical protein
MSEQYRSRMYVSDGFDSICSSLQKLQLSYEKLSVDYDKLKKEETDKSSRLQEMT